MGEAFIMLAHRLGTFALGQIAAVALDLYSWDVGIPICIGAAGMALAAFVSDVSRCLDS
jgi:hypothetical protein